MEWNGHQITQLHNLKDNKLRERHSENFRSRIIYGVVAPEVSELCSQKEQPFLENGNQHAKIKALLKIPVFPTASAKSL
jgi:hypothetical protein